MKSVLVLITSHRESTCSNSKVLVGTSNCREEELVFKEVVVVIVVVVWLKISSH